MAIFDPKNIDFSRLLLQDRVSRPQMAAIVYPQNDKTSTALSIKTDSTTVSIIYTSSATTTLNISYVGKSVSEVVDEINASTIPVQAVATSRAQYLEANDFIPTANYQQIPSGFTAYERVANNGVILRIARYTVKHNTKKSIGILAPFEKSALDPWYPRISVGKFTQVYKGNYFHFDVPEYDNQTWSLRYGKPFKDVRDITLKPLGGNAFKMPFTPVFWNGENITLFNGSSPLSSTSIRDIDIAKGILYLEASISADQGISVDYSYLEEGYEYRDININAHFTQNPSLIDKFVLIYAKPIEGGISTSKSRGIYHVIADSIPEAINSITVQPEIPIAIIGAYNIQQIFASDRVTILDTRVRGGGLQDRLKGPESPIHDLGQTLEPVSNLPTIESKYKEAQNFWDIGNYDGEAYPGAAAVVVDIPDYLKEVLPLDEIKKKATKFLSAGVYPIFNVSSRDLPGISGKSAQIACGSNLNFKDAAANGKSGIGWYPTRFGIPYGSVLTGWPSDFEITAVKTAIHGTSAVGESTPGTGMYTTYLKSSPIAGLQWSERAVVYNSGDNDNPVEYGPWETKTVFDTRLVEGGRLLKGYFSIEDDYGPKQIKDLVIHAPYRTDETGVLKERIILELDTITGFLQENLTFTGAHRGVNKTVTNASQHLLSDLTGYYGLHTSYNYVKNIPGTTLHRKYSGVLDNITADMYKAVTGGGANQDDIFSVFSTSLFQGDGGWDTAVNQSFELAPQLDLLAAVLEHRFLLYGTGDASYSILNQCFSGIWSNTLSGESGSYQNPTEYIPGKVQFNSVGQYSGVPFTTGTWLEVHPSGEDHKLLDTHAALMRYARATDTLSGSAHPNLTGMFSRVLQDVTGLVRSRFPLAVTGQPVSGTEPMAHHWYAPHDRYGEFAGSIAKNITRIYDHIRQGHVRVDDVSASSGVTPGDLDTYFQAVNDVLLATYTGFSETLQRGGILDDYTHRLIYSYAWYAANAHRSYTITGLVPDNYSRFKGLAISGLHYLTKGMVTPEGNMYQAPIINQEPGPYTKSIPGEYFESIAQGYDIDQPTITLGQAAFSTVTGLYSKTGIYPLYPDRDNSPGGGEHALSEGLSYLHSKLDTGSANALWEPLREDLGNVRGFNYLPVYPGFDAVDDHPATGWRGAASKIAIWKWYQSGDIETQLTQLRGMGVNGIRVFLEYYVWRDHETLGYTTPENPMTNSFKHLLKTAEEKRIYVQPVLWDNVYTSPFRSGEPDPVDPMRDYRYWTKSPGDANISNQWMDLSGRSYVEDMIRAASQYDSVFCWDIMNEPPVTGKYETFFNYNLGLLTSGDPNPFHRRTIGVPNTLNFGPDIFSGQYHFPAQTDRRLDVYSVHPYAIFGQVWERQLNFTTEYQALATGVAVLINEDGGNFEPYYVAIERATGAINAYGNTGVGFLMFQSHIGNLSEPFNTSQGLIYADGEVRDIRSVEKLQEAAVAQGFPKESLTKFREKTLNHNENTTAAWTQSVSQQIGVWDANDLIDIITGSEWNNRTSLSGLLYESNTTTPLLDMLLAYFTQSFIVSSIATDLQRINDFSIGLTGSQYTHEYISRSEQIQLHTAYTGYLGSNLLSAPIAGWYITPEGGIDAGRYERFFTEWGELLTSVIQTNGLSQIS